MHVQPPGSFEPQYVASAVAEGCMARMSDPCAAAPRLRADPLADETVARILGAWNEGTPPLSRWQAIAVVERAMASWDTNGALGAWRADEDTPAPIAAALESYVRQARRLPAWCDAAKIGCAEAAFADIGMLSFTLLACASLPQSDVLVDPLGQPPEDRLRCAASLLCAVLLRGGLLDPAGAGVAQVLRLRLRNALKRHLIVRGNPAEALAHGAAIPALRCEGSDAWRTLFARGWNVRANGLPRNQEELACALLSFHYVFLRGLRRLGQGLGRQEEGAWLHAWNVAGHLLGIEEALLAATMKDAARLLARLEQDARAGAGARYAAPARKGAAPVVGKMADPRPALAAGLMRTLQDGIGSPAWRPFPVLLARRLCGRATARTLGLDGRVSCIARALFACAMAAARGVDGLALASGFSGRRLAARMLGRRVALRCVIDPARPLDLPEALLRQVHATVQDWETDPAAPGWVNAVERRCGPRGSGPGAREAAPC
jgi:hypothetical protein